MKAQIINNSAFHNPQSTLPPGWRWVRLGEVCEVNPSRPKNFTRSSETPTSFIPMVAVDEKTGTIAKPEVVPYSKVAKGYTYFEENDVLFAKITPCMQNGKHVIARNLIDGIGFGTTEFHVLRSKKEVLSEWIYFFIRQPYFLRKATAYFTGAVGQQRIPEYFLSDYVIPLPLIEEQHRIAVKIQELMQEIERARMACEKQLEAAKALPAAYLREVFESEEAKKWERKRLGEVCLLEYGTGLPERGRVAGSVPVFGSNGIVGYHNIAITKGDTIIIGRKGSIGQVNYSELPCWPIDTTYYIDSSKTSCNLVWLYWLLKWIRLDLLNKATGVPGLNREDAYSQIIPLPSISEQHSIAAELKEKMSQVENLQSAILNQQFAIETLPQAILRKAFRGEL